MPKKGSQFERDVCRRLSVWWSGDPDCDDLFWRTSQSGGRATVRFRKNKGTRGHCGDISATDPEGEPLVGLITFELKRGYNKYTVHELLDRGPQNKTQGYESFLEQAIAAAERSGSPFWMIIHKRDMRQPIVVLPIRLSGLLEDVAGCCLSKGSGAVISALIKKPGSDKKRRVVFAVVDFESFLKGVDRGDILAVASHVRRKGKR